uniref:DUF547 domain-containing protein n=1 Tax=Schlesneria paludicola TaxID=360056 RepID=A0A7C2JXT8_9PLAN
MVNNKEVVRLDEVVAFQVPSSIGEVACSRCWAIAACAWIMIAGVVSLVYWEQCASAKEPLGRQWSAAQYASMDQIDHSPFDALLHKYVDQDGFVNYAEWRRSATDRKALQDYLSSLSRASVSQKASREAQLAFWINAYNAVTLEGILQVYPTDSIRNHTSKFGGYNLWKDLPLLVGGKPFSLDDIEHQVLRKLGEPRIHFAIVCASIGCPRLRNEAYVPERINEQLADNARDFFSRPQNLKVDPASHTLSLSSILDWFGGDFGRSQPEQLRFLQPYLPQSAQALAQDPNVRIRYQDYNWSLNDRAKKPAARGEGSTRR